MTEVEVHDHPAGESFPHIPLPTGRRVNPGFSARLRGSALDCLRFSLVVLILLNATGVMGQLPIIRGQSEARSGMLCYDVDDADDMRARTYLYTLCPAQVSCMWLDFNLLESSGGVDFIRVFDGPDRDAPLLGMLGGKSGSMLLQGGSGCLTVEFTRAERGIHSVWTAGWRSGGEEDCLDPLRTKGSLGFQDACGPEFWENRPQWRLAGEQETGENARWYRIVTQRSGALGFTLTPDNMRDDYDWALYGGDRGAPSVLPDREASPLVSNACWGGSRQASTGMGPDGDRFLEQGAGNPFCRMLQVEKGDVFFLRVEAGQEKCGGFHLQFNETVFQCDEPVGEVVQVAHAPDLGEVPVLPRDMFSRSTSVLRLDLAAKANLPLAEARVAPEVWKVFGEGFPKSVASGFAPELEGLVQALLFGLRSGMLRAYAAHDFATPVHYGDLLAIVREGLPQDEEPLDSIYGPPPSEWLSPQDAKMAGFTNVLELIVDDVFDKRTGRERRIVRFVRLIWSDWEGDLPDYNVAVFRYAEVEPLLNLIEAGHSRNEASSLDLEDLLTGQKYEAIPIWRSGKAVRTPQEGKYLEDRRQEMEYYKWR